VTVAMRTDYKRSEIKSADAVTDKIRLVCGKFHATFGILFVEVFGTVYIKLP